MTVFTIYIVYNISIESLCMMQEFHHTKLSEVLWFYLHLLQKECSECWTTGLALDVLILYDHLLEKKVVEEPVFLCLSISEQVIGRWSHTFHIVYPRSRSLFKEMSIIGKLNFQELNNLNLCVKRLAKHCCKRQFNKQISSSVSNSLYFSSILFHKFKIIR